MTNTPLRPLTKMNGSSATPTAAALARPTVVPTGAARPAANVKLPGKPGPSELPLPTLPSAAATRMTAFIFGYSGSGKTFLLRSIMEAPEMLPCLYLVCDASQASVADLFDNVNIVPVKISTFEELVTMYTYLQTSRRFKTVFVDGLTELYRSIFMSIVRKRTGQAGKPLFDISRNDYGDARVQFLEFVASYTLELTHLNVFMTALAADIQDEATSTVSTEPNVSGKLSYEVPGYFDVSGYLKRVVPTSAEKRQAAQAGLPEPTSKRVLLVDQTSQVTHARNRGGKLGQQVVEPTMLKLLRAYVPASVPNETDAEELVLSTSDLSTPVETEA